MRKMQSSARDCPQPCLRLDCRSSDTHNARRLAAVARRELTYAPPRRQGHVWPCHDDDLEVSHQCFNVHSNVGTLL